MQRWLFYVNLIPKTLLSTAAKRRREPEGGIPLSRVWGKAPSGFGIVAMRPLCGIQHGGNRKSQGALARLCEFPGVAIPSPPQARSATQRESGSEAKPDSTPAAFNRREAEKGFGDNVPKWVWAIAQRNPPIGKNVVSAQNAKYSAIETGSMRKSLFCPQNSILKPLFQPPRSEEGVWAATQRTPDQEKRSFSAECRAFCY